MPIITVVLLTMEKAISITAIQDYNKAIEFNPQHASGPITIVALLIVIKGDFDNAIQDYNKALGVNPEYANAYNNRGVVSFIQKRMGESQGRLNESQGYGS